MALEANDRVDQYAQTRLAVVESLLDRVVAVSVLHGEVALVEACICQRLAILEEERIERVAGDTALLGRTTGVVDQTVHHNVFLIVAEEDNLLVAVETESVVNVSLLGRQGVCAVHQGPRTLYALLKILL